MKKDKVFTVRVSKEKFDLISQLAAPRPISSYLLNAYHDYLVAINKVEERLAKLEVEICNRIEEKFLE